MPVEMLAIGRVLRPHGVRGELLLEQMTDFPEHLREVETVYLGEPAEPHPLAGFRQHRGQLLIRLGDCPDRDCAEALRGALVQVRAEAAAPLPPGRYYHHQLTGLPVVTDEGEALGELAEIIETGANDVYVVRGPSGEILLPAIRSVILKIDLEARQILVHLIEGLR
jgi:16S rRNA processing protein RimM